MNRPAVLIVDDEEAIRRMVRRTLEQENLATSEADSGEHALRELAKNSFDLVILDINMADMDGFEVIQEMRKRDISTPVFLLSGRSEDYDQIFGYGIGADAYITKPFSPAVLSAMVRANLRKNKAAAKDNKHFIEIPPFRFDKQSYTLYKNKTEIPLSYKEAQLMRLFMENKDVVFTKAQLYDNIWNDTPVSDNNIMVFIRKLRMKIEDDPNEPKYLKTIWGIGYMFTE